jgi:hypothetical protein
MQPVALTPTVGASPPQGGTQVVGLMMERPRLFHRILGAIGRELTPLGAPTVRVTSMPTLAQMALPTTPVGVLAQPAPAPVFQQPAPAYQAQPQPSPQSVPVRKHHFFDHD